MNAAIFSLFAGNEAWLAAIELATKSTLLLAIVLLGHSVLRRRHALACSALWNACVLGLLLLPVAILFAPDYGLPAPWLSNAGPTTAAESHAAQAFNAEAVRETIPQWQDASAVDGPLATTRQSQPALAANNRSTIVESTTSQLESAPAIDSAAVPVESGADRRVWILSIYAAGVALFALRLVLNLLAVQRLRSKAAPIDHPAWSSRLAHWSDVLGLRRRVALRTSDDVAVPVIVGWRRSMILLPPDAAESLTRQRIDGVLVHELAHVRRGDYGWQLGAIACASDLLAAAANLVRQSPDQPRPRTSLR
jgi:beta-lactamase regulating signal transducer with metallopeptidase domain